MAMKLYVNSCFAFVMPLLVATPGVLESSCHQFVPPASTASVDLFPEVLGRELAGVVVTRTGVTTGAAAAEIRMIPPLA